MENDDVLVRRLQKSDQGALEAALSQYTPYVLTVLTNRLGSAATAEDVEELAANVFCALWTHRKELKTDHLRGWLASVARNEALAFLRKCRLPTVSAEDWLTVEGDQTDRLLEQAERKRILAIALDALDRKSRETVLRHYYYGQTVDQIAEAMKEKPATVKSRLQRGRQKLREALRKGGYCCEDEDGTFL